MANGETFHFVHHVDPSGARLCRRRVTGPRYVQQLPFKYNNSTLCAANTRVTLVHVAGLCLLHLSDLVTQAACSPLSMPLSTTTAASCNFPDPKGNF